MATKKSYQHEDDDDEIEDIEKERSRIALELAALGVNEEVDIPVLPVDDFPPDYADLSNLPPPPELPPHLSLDSKAEESEDDSIESENELGTPEQNQSTESNSTTAYSPTVIRKGDDVIAEEKKRKKEKKEKKIKKDKHHKTDSIDLEVTQLEIRPRRVTRGNSSEMAVVRKTRGGERVMTLSKDIGTLINDSEYSDISFIVEGKKINGHKAILASRCPYFKKTFDLNKAAKEVQIKEFSYNSFMEFLEWIYTANISHLKSDSVPELQSIAFAYEMTEMQKYLDRYGIGGSPRDSFDRSYSVGGAGDVMSDAIKMQEKRRTIAREIYDTERAYFNALRTVQKEFIDPILRFGVLTKDEVLSIVSYWEVMVNCHGSLLKAIDERVSIWDSKPEIGDILLEKTTFIKMYKHYVNNFDNSIIVIKRFKESNKHFRDFLSQLEYTPKLNKLNLNGYLIMPVQRIPRYVLLIQDMIKNTPIGHPDHDNLKAALQQIKELADYINIRKHDADEINKILSIQDRIIGWPSKQTLVKDNRRLIRDGKLYMNKDKFRVFLFTDSLLYCKKQSKDKLKYKGLISLQTTSINTKVKPGEKWHFELISPSGKLYFNTEKEEDKESWIKVISDTIESSQKELLSSAFGGAERKIHDGSKQFMKLREEEHLRKRSETSVKILEAERSYVDNLSNIIKLFLDPIQQSTTTQYPILNPNEITAIFSNIEAILKSHNEFLDHLQKRVDSFDINTTTLGDLFMEHIVNTFKLYTQYVEKHPLSIEQMEIAMGASLNFATFVVTREKDNKVSLAKTFQLPLQKLPNYYLMLEELFEYTPDNHPDHEKLKIVVSRIKENTSTLQSLNKNVTDSRSRVMSTIGKSSGSNLTNSQLKRTASYKGKPISSISSSPNLNSPRKNSSGALTNSKA